jgi:hypothetical protein
MKWLLIIYVSAHTGWISVPGIASEAECHRLAKEIVDTSLAGSYLGDQPHTCTAYQTE